jgi:hypothetical protein
MDPYRQAPAVDQDGGAVTYVGVPESAGSVGLPAEPDFARAWLRTATRSKPLPSVAACSRLQGFEPTGFVGVMPTLERASEQRAQPILDVARAPAPSLLATSQAV